MNRTTILAVTLATVLFLSSCIGAGELSEDLETHSIGYDLSIDLPKGWVKTEWEMLPSGEFSMECYPSEHSRNPDIEIHIYYPDTRDLDRFVEHQLKGVSVDEVRDYAFPEMAGKKVVQRDNGYEYVRFYFPVEETESGSEMLYLYGRLSFRRDLSTFNDAEWSRFVEKVANSLEYDY
jgi:hypothetical protein